MKPQKIYLDNSLLVRWFLRKLKPEKYEQEPQIIRFLSGLTGVEKFISLISLAELINTLKHGDDFKRYNLTLPIIGALIEEMQSTVGFKIITTENIRGTEVEGIIITPFVLRLIDIHGELADCLYVDIARRNSLSFITHESRIGRLKELYDNTMTDDKLMKQP